MLLSITWQQASASVALQCSMFQALYRLPFCLHSFDNPSAPSSFPESFSYSTRVSWDIGSSSLSTTYTILCGQPISRAKSAWRANRAHYHQLTDARHDLPNLYTLTWISDFQLPHIFLFLTPTDDPLFYYLFRRRTGMDNWIVLGELPLAANMGEICAVYASGAFITCL